MPKLKTNKTAAKRFRRTKGGKGDKLMFKHNKHHGIAGRSRRWRNRTNKKMGKRTTADPDTKRMIKLIE